MPTGISGLYKNTKGAREAECGGTEWQPMNKQIEEMAKDICKLGKPCEKCSAYPDACNAVKYAERSYNAGHRKQSEGENISQMHPSDEFICEKCGLIIRDCCRYEIDEDNGDETCFEFPYKFCPRCGMKVKGGAE